LILTALSAIGMASSSVFAQDESAAKDLFLESIERNIRVGQERQALHILNTLRSQEYQGVDSPRFLFLEIQALNANGYADEAYRRIEALKEMPNWEETVSREELLEVEVQVLKAIGQPLDALGLIEQELPPLDLEDPPYPVDTTQKYLLYADLLVACGRFDTAVETLFDLLENGASRYKDEVIEALLKAGQHQVLGPEDFEKVLKALPDLSGVNLWDEFSRAAFLSGYSDMAGQFLKEGFTDFAPKIRLDWERFLETLDDSEYLKLVDDTITEVLDATGESHSLDQKIVAAMTYQKVGKSERAVELTREIAESDNLTIQLFAAKLYGAEGYLEEAAAIYEKLEKKAPGRFIEDWGTLYANSGDPEKALETWSKIPEKHGNTVEGYLVWGRLLKDKGFLEESKDAFMEGIERTGNPLHFAYELLEVSLSLSDVEGALTAYESLRKQSSPGTGRSVWTPGRLLNKLKITQQAEAFSEKLADVLDATKTVQADWRDFAVELATDLALQLNQNEIFEDWIHSPPAALVAYWEASPIRKINHLMDMGTELSFKGEDKLAVQILDLVDPQFFVMRLDAAEAGARSHEEIGDASDAIRYWKIVHNSKRASRMNLRESEMAIARLYLQQHNAGEALKWLNKIDEDKEARTLAAEVKFLKGLTYTQLHEKRKAISYLEDVMTLGMKHSADAVFWLAEWELYQRNQDEAEKLYRQVLSMDPGQELANDALERLRHLTQLEEDQIPPYSLAAFFEVGGDWKDAEENYRKLAGQLPAGDLSDWVYYRLGKIMIQTGRTQEGFDQWALLLERTTSQTLKRKVRLEMLQIQGTDQADPFEEIVMEDPNSLIGDLARDEMLSNMEEKPELAPASPLP
ncbi:MAG: hypothetical protein KC944_22190, partial [Candidatus Omnitrophica bacterium]|nr:hypothetical protein [Candidatus Omnitrophota bacterium]